MPRPLEWLSGILRGIYPGRFVPSLAKFSPKVRVRPFREKYNQGKVGMTIRALEKITLGKGAPHHRIGNPFLKLLKSRPMVSANFHKNHHHIVLVYNASMQSATAHISSYLKLIEKNLKRGDATEHTHRPALKALIEAIGERVTATNEPKRIECGAPDFIITRGQIPLGYIEAKDVGTGLDAVEKSEQMKRYLASLGNLILTDYLEFRWYVQGEFRQSVRIGRAAPGGKLRADTKGEAEFSEMLQLFLSHQTPTIRRPKELAERMASIARLVRNLIEATFRQESEACGAFHSQLAAFRETLIPDLEPGQFADMYAQTIAYGLFAARVNDPEAKEFSREKAAWTLPKTNPFLKELFNQIAGQIGRASCRERV